MAGATAWNAEAVTDALKRSSGEALARAATVLSMSLLGDSPRGGYECEPHEGRQEEAVAAGALEAVGDALLREPGNAGVQFALVSALGALCGGQPTFRARAVNGGVLPMVVRALLTHGVAAEPCCNALYTLVSHSEAHVRAAMDLGAIEAVVDAMRAAPADTGVQTGGFRALYNMICGKTPADPIRKRAVATEVVEHTVWVLKRHKDAADVVYWASELLSVLCAPGEREAGVSAVDSGMVRAAATGAVAALVLAARLHPAEARVQLSVAGAVMCMAQTPCAQARADIVEWMVAVSRKHAAECKVVTMAFTAVVAMSTHCTHSERAVCTSRATGLAECVAAALRTHIGDGDCITTACGVLHMMLLFDESHGCAMEAVACGIAALLPDAERASWTWRDWAGEGVRLLCAKSADLLQRAEQLHDAARCTRTERCVRCEAAREAGAMCGLPRCGLRTRAGGGKLQRCKGCLSVVFCSVEHQREMWPQHKVACKAAQAARTAAT